MIQTNQCHRVAIG